MAAPPPPFIESIRNERMSKLKQKMGYNEPALVTEYVGVKKGWAVVGGQRCYFKSGLEHRWAIYLEFLKHTDPPEIVSWAYEPHKFEFKVRSGTVFYVPDFLVVYPGEICLWHEVKGHFKQKDVTKFHRMHIYYPSERILLVLQNIPETSTRKNRTKILRIQKAKKYIERVMDAEKTLKQAGL